MSALAALAIAIVGAIVGAYLTKLWTPNPNAEIASLRQQVAQLQERIDASEKDRLAQKQDDDLWSRKFEAAASQVVKIGPSLIVRSPKGDSDMPLYGLIFPDVEMKTRIQTFLVEPDSRYISFSMRMFSDEQLRRPIVRQVVDETLGCLDAFKKEHPGLAIKYLSAT